MNRQHSNDGAVRLHDMPTTRGYLGPESRSMLEVKAIWKQQDVRFILKVSPWYFRCFCHIIPASHGAIFFTYVFFVFVFFVSLKLWKDQKCKAMTNSPNVTERKQTSGTAGKRPVLVPTMLPFLQIINLQEGHARTIMWPNSAWKRSWFVSSLTCRSCDIGKSKHYCRNILELPVLPKYFYSTSNCCFCQ